MGTNTLSSRTDGERIPAADHNELVQALQIDLVPRNNSRAPEDVIGQLGTSVYRWLRGYIKELRVGASGNNLKIYEGLTGEVWIENPGGDSIRLKDGSIAFHVNSIKEFEVGSDGIVWTVEPDKNIPTTKVNDKSYFTVVNATLSNSTWITGNTTNLTILEGKVYLMTFDFEQADKLATVFPGIRFKEGSTIVREWTSVMVAGDTTRGAATLSFLFIALSTASSSFSYQYQGDFTDTIFTVTEL